VAVEAGLCDQDLHRRPEGTLRFWRVVRTGRRLTRSP
jgi:hypothetical protein